MKVTLEIVDAPLYRAIYTGPDSDTKNGILKYGMTGWVESIPPNIYVFHADNDGSTPIYNTVWFVLVNTVYVTEDYTQD